MSASEKKRVARVLDALAKHYGPIAELAPTDAYALVVFLNCGYPASDEACARGFAALERSVGTTPRELRAARKSKLVTALRAGGLVPELRADRLKEIARAVLHDHLDLTSRDVLKALPTFGEPAADRILLFTRTTPVAAVPAGAMQVPLRLGLGTELKSWAATYRSIQAALEAVLPRTLDARIRAYSLLKRHGHETCRRARPACDRCPVTRDCVYFSENR